jgi:hypothetical protein
MSKSIEVLPGKRGRPAKGKDPMLNFRSPPALTASLDAWVAAQPEPRPSRSEAIRNFVAQALGRPAAVESPSDGNRQTPAAVAPAKALAKARKSRGRR